MQAPQCLLTSGLPRTCQQRVVCNDRWQRVAMPWLQLPVCLLLSGHVPANGLLFSKKCFMCGQVPVGCRLGLEGCSQHLRPPEPAAFTRLDMQCMHLTGWLKHFASSCRCYCKEAFPCMGPPGAMGLSVPWSLWPEMKVATPTWSHRATSHGIALAPGASTRLRCGPVAQADAQCCAARHGAQHPRRLGPGGDR